MRTAFIWFFVKFFDFQSPLTGGDNGEGPGEEAICSREREEHLRERVVAEADKGGVDDRDQQGDW